MIPFFISLSIPCIHVYWCILCIRSSRLLEILNLDFVASASLYLGWFVPFDCGDLFLMGSVLVNLNLGKFGG